MKDAKYTFSLFLCKTLQNSTIDFQLRFQQHFTRAENNSSSNSNDEYIYLPGNLNSETRVLIFSQNSLEGIFLVAECVRHCFTCV